MNLPALIYGGGVFSNTYNTDDHLVGEMPLRSLRLAFR